MVILHGGETDIVIMYGLYRENLSLEAGLKHLSVKKSRSEEVPLLLVSLLNSRPHPQVALSSHFQFPGELVFPPARPALRHFPLS